MREKDEIRSQLVDSINFIFKPSIYEIDQENLEKMRKEVEESVKKLQQHKTMTPEMIWKKELNEFIDEYKRLTEHEKNKDEWKMENEKKSKRVNEERNDQSRHEEEGNGRRERRR